MKYPASIQNLINFFSKLPTVGPKTAERYVFYMLQQSDRDLDAFSKAISELKKNIKICSDCGAVSEKNPCSICSDQTRDQKVLCVVENTRDMLAIENTGQYKGLYHILGAVIDLASNIGPEKLNTAALLDKIKNKKITEVVIALNPDLEGETTAMHVAKILQPTNVKITRIARGLPMGADLEYADEITLGNALKYRTKL